MRKTHIIIMALISIVLLACYGCNSDPTGAVSGEEVVFGALLSLTGDGSSSGESAKAALEVAVLDANEYLSRMGSSRRINIVVEDTQTDPEVALEKLESLVEEGVNVVIGPLTSAEVKAAKAYADENDVLLLSPSSSAPSLKIEGDNLFRFVSNDIHQVEVITRWIWEREDIEVVIPMWRGGVWGDDLAKYLTFGFESMGGTVLDGVRYDPAQNDYSVDLASLSAKVSEAVGQYGADVVAVHLVAYGEVADPR